MADQEPLPDYEPTEAEVMAAQEHAVSQTKVGGSQSGGAVMRMADEMRQYFQFIQFRNRPMALISTPFPHYLPLRKEVFDRIGYPVLGGQTRGRMADIYSYISNTSDDLSEYDHQILFGMTPADASTSRVFEHAPIDLDAKPYIWDMRRLEWQLALHQDERDRCVWRSPYCPVKPRESAGPVDFIMDLAGGDQGKYDDIMQSLAPLVMEKKPDGAIWWIGDGANGKSTLMDAIYRIFPDLLASLTVKRLTDGRDTPSLNGVLANVVKESSEGRIDDTEIYKSVSTHEDFRVHKFHSQDDVTIRGNVHHIFSANAIPVFNDKGFSARRRTFIIPFTERFQSDPTFETRTFTPDMFGRLIAEMCRYAQRLRKQGYKYKFSALTTTAKESYDSDANNAERYAASLMEEGIVAFDSFTPVRQDYENWCSAEGYVPLGIGNMRNALQAAGFRPVNTRIGDKVSRKYRLQAVKAADLVEIGGWRKGLYTTAGFQPELSPDDKAVVPDMPPPDDPEPLTDDARRRMRGGW